jgi:LuxR family maltose regulon positive regulatory protein
VSSTLLGSKLHSPVLRSGIVPRARLTDAATSCDAAVVLVVAPPGFGKTVLLAQWEELDDRPFAWVSLDRRDNDPLVLWNYLVAAIGRIKPGFGSSVEAALGSAGGMVLDAVVPRILNELEATDQEIVLVLDDYHWVTSQACHESITFMVERAPPNVQLVLASRSDPPLPFGRLRASGGLFEFRASDLGFTEVEAVELFGAFGLDLAAGSIAAVQRRTEGWPAGLYLALLAVRGVNDPTAALVEFGGSSRNVVEYLTEVVLESQTDEHRAFLLETSILTRMCASLCDRVTGRRDSARVLAEIERANLFLVPLDGRGEWFRYHHLFAELLSDELRRQHTDAELELHRRACEWFESAGYADEAIQHAIIGSNFEAAAALIARHWVAFAHAGRLATLTAWLAAFPRDFFDADARLRVIEVWLLYLAGSTDEAKRALATAGEARYDGELPDGSGTVDESLTLIRATFPWSDVGATLTAARSAYETESRRRSLWYPLAVLNLGMSLHLAGESDDAAPLLRHAVQLATQNDSWIVAGDACALLAEISLTSGDLAQAEAWVGEALDLAHAHGFADMPHVGFYHVTIGVLHARRGDLELADDTIALGLEQVQRREGAVLPVSRALLERALVRRALGARTEARAMLAEARAIIENCADPGMLAARVEVVARKLTPAYVRADPDSALTERELEVLGLLAEGLTKREVAAKLYLSYSTVHSHTKSIYRKLGASSRDEVVEQAHRMGLLSSA